ncbi:MAG: mandelate racemase/muconate lactonizing enzyme family protein, partial [Bryobacteraceae bacterium]
MALNRRTFVAGTLALPMAEAYLEAAQSAPSMRIQRIETVYWKSGGETPFRPNWTWVKIETDSGVSGIGETYPHN